MFQYIIRRLLILPVVMFVVTTLLFFFMLQLPPEDRAAVYMPSMRPMATPEEIQEVIQRTIDRYGLDDPFPVQYVTWLRNLLRGNWGYSPSWQQPVLEGLIQRTPASIELAFAAMFPALLLTLLLGGLTARFFNRPIDRAIRVATFIGWAFPSFIMGLMLLNVLYAWLGWLPPERLSVSAQYIVDMGNFRSFTGLYTVDALLNGNLEVFADAVRHLVLPAFALGLAQWALLTRVFRSSLIEVMSKDYIVTARSKGLSERKVINRHARRNAILPVISSSGVIISYLISGVVVIEAVFNYDGIGRAAVTAILNMDVSSVVGFTLFSCLVTVLASLVADLLYAVVDPRTRLQRSEEFL